MIQREFKSDISITNIVIYKKTQSSNFIYSYSNFNDVVQCKTYLLHKNTTNFTWIYNSTLFKAYKKLLFNCQLPNIHIIIINWNKFLCAQSFLQTLLINLNNFTKVNNRLIITTGWTAKFSELLSWLDPRNIIKFHCCPPVNCWLPSLEPRSGLIPS